MAVNPEPAQVHLPSDRLPTMTRQDPGCGGGQPRLMRTGHSPFDAVPLAESPSRRLQAQRWGGRRRGSPAAHSPPPRVTLAAGLVRFGAAELAAYRCSEHVLMQKIAPQLALAALHIAQKTLLCRIK